MLGDYAGISPVKFGQDPVSSFRGYASVKMLKQDGWGMPYDNGRQSKAGHNRLLWERCALVR